MLGVNSLIMTTYSYSAEHILHRLSHYKIGAKNHVTLEIAPDYNAMLAQAQPGDSLVFHDRDGTITKVKIGKRLGHGTHDVIFELGGPGEQNKVIRIPQAFQNNLGEFLNSYRILKANGAPVVEVLAPKSHLFPKEDRLLRFLIEKKVNIEFMGDDVFHPHPAITLDAGKKKLIEDKFIDFIRSLARIRSNDDFQESNIAWNGAEWVWLDWGGRTTLFNPKTTKLDDDALLDFFNYTDKNLKERAQKALEEERRKIFLPSPGNSEGRQSCPATTQDSTNLMGTSNLNTKLLISSITQLNKAIGTFDKPAFDLEKFCKSVNQDDVRAEAQQQIPEFLSDSGNTLAHFLVSNFRLTPESKHVNNRDRFWLDFPRFQKLLQCVAKVDYGGIWNDTQEKIREKFPDLESKQPGEFLSRVQRAAFKRALSQKNGYGKTPAHLAAEQGNPEMIRFLNLTGPVDLKDNDGKTPAHLAAELGHLEVLQDLSPSATRIKDDAGNNAFDIYSKKWGSRHKIPEEE